MIIAIDGPAGSGKSSTAQALAYRLGGFYLDTGAMYRAVGLALVPGGGEDIGEQQARSLLNHIQFDLVPDASSFRVSVNGTDVTEKIRTPEAATLASRVSRLAAVRERLVAEQRKVGRRLSEDGQIVIVEGRDIGTVVFPEADVKFYMEASTDIRAERRHRDLRRDGIDQDIDTVRREIEVRDKQDREREHSPLRRAPDAVVIDTTELTADDQVDMMLATIKALLETRNTEI